MLSSSDRLASSRRSDGWDALIHKGPFFGTYVADTTFGGIYEASPAWRRISLADGEGFLLGSPVAKEYSASSKYPMMECTVQYEKFRGVGTYL